MAQQFPQGTQFIETGGDGDVSSKRQEKGPGIIWNANKQISLISSSDSPEIFADFGFDCWEASAWSS